jgi:hypothetical protein
VARGTRIPSEDAPADDRRHHRHPDRVGFGIPGVLGLRHFLSTGTVWTFMGFPTYGGGPFERLGLPTSTPLLAGFIAVCALEVLLGLFLLIGPRAALWLSFALLPFELAFWWGFSLPFGFVFAALRCAAVVVALL